MDFVLQFLPLLSGIGLFLYGMSLLGSSLEKMAGAGMERTLERMTNNRVKGVLLGTGVTAVIQSSSATTIMTVGLLNAGILKLAQALPVIMGANIGTTVTGQLLRLGDIGTANVLLALLKPASFGPILIAIGAILCVFSRKNNRKTIGSVFIGLGMIFFGMSTMEATLSPLSEAQWFSDTILLLENPLLGILFGAVMTAVLQSSSASVGILQALSSTGAITFGAAVPIILGQNVGKCVTVLLASVGGKKNAKRAVFLHLAINIFGLVVFAAAIYGFQSIWGFSFWNQSMSRGNIADFHTLFSVVTVVLLLPFTDWLISLSKRFIKDKELSSTEESLQRLDDLLLQTPSVAIQQVRQVLSNMLETAIQNFGYARKLLLEKFDESTLELLNDNESVLDRSESALNNYILRITSQSLSYNDSKLATFMLHAVSDFERIGDHCVNICDVAVYNHEHKISFSPQAQGEFRVIFDAVEQVLSITSDAYRNNDISKAQMVEPLEQVIDGLQHQMKDRHVDRLRQNLCDFSAGTSYMEVITALERISDHCSNVAVGVIQLKSNRYTEFSSHLHLEHLHREPTEEYQRDFANFSQTYQLRDEQPLLEEVPAAGEQ